MLQATRPTVFGAQRSQRSRVAVAAVNGRTPAQAAQVQEPQVSRLSKFRLMGHRSGPLQGPCAQGPLALVELVVISDNPARWLRRGAMLLLKPSACQPDK